ncbi:hypothetical protein MRX96_009270 [Rhipicephalus microplus]
MPSTFPFENGWRIQEKWTIWWTLCRRQKYCRPECANRKHERGANFGGIPSAQLDSLPSWTPQESREKVLPVQRTAAEGAVRRLSKGTCSARKSTSVPTAAIPQHSNPPFATVQLLTSTPFHHYRNVRREK